MMEAGKLFIVNVDNDLLWMGYLLSFPEGEERQSHNCNACKSFIRHMSKAVSIDPVTYEIKTFWDDVHTPGYEKTAADLAKLVKEAAICNIFMQDMNEFHGCDHNIQRLPDGSTRQWNHLYVNLPVTYRFNERTSHFSSLAAFPASLRFFPVPSEASSASSVESAISSRSVATPPVLIFIFQPNI